VIRRTVLALVALAVPAPFAPGLVAQGWAADVYAGHAVHDPVSAEIGTSNAVLGIRRSGGVGNWLYVSGALPLAAEDPLWAATGIGFRPSVGGRPWSVGAEISVHAYVYSDRSSGLSPGLAGRGATAQALPFVSLQAGPARVELLSGVAHHSHVFSGQRGSRTLHESAARFILGRNGLLEVVGETRYLRAEEGNYPYGGASLSLRQGHVATWGGFGHWFSDVVTDLSWHAGASLDLGSRSELWLSLRQDPPHPLYWNDARRSWNAGLRYRFGQRAPAPLPAPYAPVVSGGRVTIRIPVSESREAPDIAGDFSRWALVPMTRSGDHWAVTLELGPGVYHYAFRSKGGEWFVPLSVAGRREDGFGGHVAMLVVP
jgi:hypothetical protein